MESDLDECVHIAIAASSQQMRSFLPEGSCHSCLYLLRPIFVNQVGQPKQVRGFQCKDWFQYPEGSKDPYVQSLGGSILGIVVMIELYLGWVEFKRGGRLRLYSIGLPGICIPDQFYPFLCNLRWLQEKHTRAQCYSQEGICHHYMKAGPRHVETVAVQQRA